MELEELVKHGIEKEWIDRLANKAKIKRLYEYQAEIVEKKLLDESLIVSAPTASGKTLLAMLKMIKALKKGKVVYLVPLVALGVEKYEEFKKFFEGKYKVALSVGDFDSTDPWLRDYDVIVATVEKFDSLLRHGVDWIDSVRLIVVDEIHLLNDVSRGPTLEILLTKLRRILKDVQIMGLSATISNAEELANWLGCRLYKTDFRPVKLYQGVAYDSKIRFIDKEGYELGEGEIDEEIVKNTLSLNKQILFFVGTRKRSEALAEKLAQVVKQKLSKLSLEQLAKVAEEVENVLEVPTRQCKKLAKCIRCGVAFHHAGLLGKQKRLIEENFRNGLIKVIVATTTLAAGINTPAFRVAIRDVKRYYPGLGAVYIPVIEYQQMVGRCVAGDTLVFNKNGFPIQISEIASKYFKPNEVGRKDVKEDLEILSVDLNNFQPTLSKVLSIWKRKVNKLVEIETKSGKIIRVSPDHPILTFRKVGCDASMLYDRNELKVDELVWKRAGELRKGSCKNADHIVSLSDFSATKSQFDNNKRLSSVGHIHPDMIKNIREINEEAYVYDLTLERNHNFVANGVVVHNSGRPQYDPYGEGILIAKNEDEAEELIERYLMGEAEPITSKLASEPALRMHTLALIATDFCKTEKSLKDFFDSTFFAYHYGDTYLIEEKIEKILDDLEEWNFITHNNRIEATRIGKRVVELYLDPLTAWWFVKGLEKKDGSIFGYLQLISQSLEMRPLPSVSTSDMVEIEKLIESKREEFLVDVPNEYDLDYEDFVRSVKLALMLEDWMNEATEEQILEKYRVTPGEFYTRLQIADWLVYSLQELALLLKQKEKASMIRKIRVRLKYGVKEELLPLVKLEGIGRVRARKLYNAGIRSIADLKKISLESLSRLIGAKTAKKVKDQLEEKKEKKIKQTTLA